MRRNSFCVMMRFIRREAKKGVCGIISLRRVWAAAQRFPRHPSSFTWLIAR